MQKKKMKANQLFYILTTFCLVILETSHYYGEKNLTEVIEPLRLCFPTMKA